MRERPMIMSMPTTARPQHRYDHRVLRQNRCGMQAMLSSGCRDEHDRLESTWDAHARACRSLAGRFRNGDGVRKSATAARFWAGSARRKRPAPKSR